VLRGFTGEPLRFAVPLARTEAVDDERWRSIQTTSRQGTKRAFFGSKRAAEAEAVLLRSQQAAVGDAWLALPAVGRQRLIQVFSEAKQSGVDLADLLADWKRSPRFTGSSPALESPIAELLAAKLRVQCAHEPGMGKCLEINDCIPRFMGRGAILRAWRTGV